jgi:hypothetical protein
MHRLALALGRTVAELEASISEKELRDWVDFYAVEPWGEQPAWWRTGTIAALLSNIHRDPKKSDPFTPLDFVPKDPSAEKTNGLDSRRVRAEMVEVFGTRIKRKADGR